MELDDGGGGGKEEREKRRKCTVFKYEYYGNVVRTYITSKVPLQYWIIWITRKRISVVCAGSYESLYSLYTKEQLYHWHSVPYMTVTVSRLAT